MSKLIAIAFAAMLLSPSENPVRGTFVRYKQIEAYEIRPGILMMPRYSVDGHVCEIGLEKRNFSPELIRSDSDLSRKELDEIFEKLVPSSERGPRSKNFESDVITQSGLSIVTFIEFEKVSMQIYSHEVPTSSRGKTSEVNVAAIIKWKNRKCQ